MARNEQTNDLERDLKQALDELDGALGRAAEATRTIRGMLPRLAAAGSLFDEIEALVRTGRERIGVGLAAPEAAYARPTLLVPSPSAPRPAPVIPTPAPAREEQDSPEVVASAETSAPAPEAGPREAELASFRLEFESTPGPLDLRTVDDAVSEHPAVRDVALLDYDGRRATLKVWITDEASPADVQEALKERAAQLFGTAHDVTIVALEDVA